MKSILIESLINNDCIKTGNFKLKNGSISKYYFDLKNIISCPTLLTAIGDYIYSNISENFDIICGIPYGGLPLATYISTKYNKPMILLRSSKKEYGMQKLIEGNYDKSMKCIIIDDVITSGKSLQDAYDILKEEVNVVESIVVFNRQQNYKCSFDVKCLLHKNDVIDYKLSKLIKDKKYLCFAADIKNPIDLIAKVDLIGSHIGICKIHSDIIDYNIMGFDEFKQKLIELSIKYDFLIMEDRKFVDISSVVESQYDKFCNWVDLVTVHSTVTNETISKLSGALIVANMSNNTYDYTEDAINLSKNNPNNVVGFISQHRILENSNLYTMTPGISFKESNDSDQKYRNIENVDCDFFIVGRTLYNSEDIMTSINHLISKTLEIRTNKNIE